MTPKQRHYPESRVGGFTHIDGTIAFYSQVASVLAPSSIMLDIGCGRGVFAGDAIGFRRGLTSFKGRCARVIGIDVDPIGQTNALLDEFRWIENTSRWPVDDASVDVAVADMVLEHISDIDSFFSECARVLRPNGWLCIRTPNKWSYIGVISRMIPNKAHGNVLRTAQPDRSEIDVFPTLYRCNTRGKIRRAMRRHNFDPCVYGYEAEPSYLSFSRIAYALGVLHQRLAPGFMKAAIFAFGQKQFVIGTSL
ncbi:MAG: class I SAM-dependent methyltransferase [Phycisphaerales bacterium]|nr:class I SAM-dependent methyltransferase [Phycisphaerales bacterium]